MAYPDVKNKKLMIELKTTTFYENYLDVIGYSNFNFSDILNLIKTGDYGLKEVITNLRMLTGNEYRTFKREKLPMFIGAGDFDYRVKDGLINYSNILILDFDRNDENNDNGILLELKHYLVEHANQLHLYAIWLSPGHGVKAALIHDNPDANYHYDLYWTVEDELFSEARELFPTIQYDPNCSDFTRTCFLSYDPDIFVNDSEQLEPYHFEPRENIRHQELKPKKHYTIGRRTAFEHTEEEIMLNRHFQEVCPDKRLMNYLIKSFNAHNPNYYKDGNRHTEIKRRAAIYVKDGVLFDNAVWSLVGQFGEGTWANLENNHIQSLVASIYNIARADFGTERMLYLEKRKMTKINYHKKLW